MSIRKRTNAGATLGRVLFYDKRLSLTNTHSCGSCHQQANGFAAPDRFSTGAQGTPLRRNAMALTNTRYNIAAGWFSDMRAASLEALALMPIEDPAELGNFLPLLEAKLASTDFYPALFTAAFGSPEITSDRIARALAQFLRSLISYRSKFDLAFTYAPWNPQPDAVAVLTPQELHGHNLFRLSRCGSCHSSPTFVIYPTAANNGLDMEVIDPGAGGGTFRSPSLRNTAVTAPYMHDGRFATLRQVIDHYDHGVVRSPALAYQLDDGFGSPVRLNLSEDDKDALEAFLHTLTDEELLTDPKFADPFS